MVHIEDLYTVYYLARQNKRRSQDAVAFEVRLEYNLQQLCDQINTCTFRANDNYTFVSMHPKPREIFGCEMSGRIVQWYILWRITPILEDTLTDGLCSNRKGKGIDAAVNKVYGDILTVSRRYTRDAYAIQWDVEGYYPNADCSIACEKIQRLIRDKYEGDDKDSLLWMVMITVHANPQEHYYRKCGREAWAAIDPAKSLLNKPAGQGGVIGFLIWQIAMNIYLHEVDRWLECESGLHYTRYADDSTLIVANKEAALALMPLIRARYAAVGCRMHPKKFRCQHVNKGVTFLGAHIKFERIYVDNRVIRNALNRIRQYNRCRDKEKALPNFLSTLNSYIGRLKNRNEFNNIRRLWAAVDPAWKEYTDFDWDALKVTATGKYTHRIYFTNLFKRLTLWKNCKQGSSLMQRKTRL